MPDIVVERARVTSIEGRQIKESDLKGSLDSSAEANPQDAGSESESLANLRENDNQLYEALTLLRGVNLLIPRKPMEADDQSTAETPLAD